MISKLQEFAFGVEYFDAIFMSNFLEHLSSPDELNQILTICFSRLKREGGGSESLALILNMLIRSILTALIMYCLLLTCA